MMPLLPALLVLALTGQACAAPVAPLDAGRDPLRFEELGLTSEAAGEERTARRAFTSLVDLGPEDPDLLSRAGFLAIHAGRPDLAAGYLHRARAKRPDRASRAAIWPWRFASRGGTRRTTWTCWWPTRTARSAPVASDARRGAGGSTRT